MKTTVAAGLAVLVLGGILFFILGRNPGSTSDTGPEDRTPVLATTLQKTLLVTASGATTTTPVADSTQVYVGDTLETLHTGRGLLESQNGTQTLLDYDTQVTVRTQDSAGTHQSFALAVGSVWARVQKVFGQGEFYEIQTQNVVAAVRGTSFSVTYENKVTTVVVAEGVVGCIPIDPLSHLRLPQKEVLVRAGNKARIDDAGVITVSSTTPADTGTSWYRFNGPVPAVSSTPAAPLPAPKNTPPDTASSSTSTPAEATSSTSPATSTPSEGAAAPDPYRPAY